MSRSSSVSCTSDKTDTDTNRYYTLLKDDLEVVVIKGYPMSKLHNRLQCSVIRRIQIIVIIIIIVIIMNESTVGLSQILLIIQGEGNNNRKP